MKKIKKCIAFLMIMLMSFRGVLICACADELTNSDNIKFISDMKDVYGQNIEYVSGITYEEIVYNVLEGYYGVCREQIFLGKQIDLLDANNTIVYKGYNYNINGRNYGYVTVATHTRTTLIKEIIENRMLPENASKVYYLSSQEVYYEDNLKFYTLTGIEINNKEFEDFLEERKKAYYNLSINLLEEIEKNTIAQISNLQYVIENDLANSFSGKTYNGQIGSGYGGIVDCYSYLKDRYGGSIRLVNSKTLNMYGIKMNTLEDDANNCVLTSITNILYYYRQHGYSKIDRNYYDIYNKVKKVAKRYGYTAADGVGFTKINNIVEDVLAEYGYKKGKCKGIYVWTFNEQVKKEIDGGHPVIMNIARGYYGNHTVTVCGYSIYKGSYDVKHNMIQIYDGWESKKMYIDYEAFSYDLITSGFGSFNTIRIK